MTYSGGSEVIVQASGFVLVDQRLEMLLNNQELAKAQLAMAGLYVSRYGLDDQLRNDPWGIPE